MFNRRYQNHGYMTEAMNHIIEYGLSKLGLHKIIATCGPDNIASARVLEKSGMQREGYLREDKYVKGNWRDSLLYAILGSERQ